MATRVARSVTLWTAVAAASIAWAIWTAVQPDRMLDFRELRGWLAFWNLGGHDPYAVPWLRVDYPPNAFLLLWPIAWLPGSTARLWYLIVNVAITALGGGLFARWLATTSGVVLSRAQAGVMTAMWLSIGAVRTSIWLGQTMPLALLFGVLALRASARRPILAAFALAVVAFKPHVAVGVALAIALTDGLLVPLGAALLVLLSLVLFAAIVRQDLLTMMIEYATGLVRQYGSSGHVQSATSVRELLDLMLGQRDVMIDVIQTLLAIGSLGWLVAATRTARYDGLTRAYTAAASLIWTLLVFPHQKFALMLLVPVWWLLWWPSTTLIRADGLRRAALVVLAACLFLDVPAVVQASAHHVEQYPLGALWYPAMVWIERAAGYPLHLLVIACFALVMTAIARRRRTAFSADPIGPRP